jgi:isoleucyl-tRNA synthetase
VVHTAPGHGREDFVTGMKYGLGALSPVDAGGKYTEEVGDASLVGLSIWEGNPAVIEKLTNLGALIKTEAIEHSYPHCWRCHHPVIFRATAQWFMSIDHAGHREKCLEAIENTAWHPKDSINRIRGMVEGRPDWCLSRQRAWGVGIPVFYCNSCNKEILEPETIENVRKLVLKESSDVWFEKSAKELLPEGYKCPHCGGDDFEKESDIFDVWFDSGCSNRAVLESKNWEHLSWPADVYLEGGDQHRGWFNSSLMVAVATKGAAPYKTVITNGWTLDEKGYKFSKSKGNGVAPAEVIKKYGADVLRLWVATSDYTEDLRVGPHIIEQAAEMYRRLRNTLRFSLGSIYDFNLEKDYVPYEQLLEIDRYALHQLNSLVAEAGLAYQNFEFHRAAQAIHQFCAVDMSAFYFDVLKDRLYAEGAKSIDRRSAQTVLHKITSVLARLLAPVLSFTAEEVWQKLHVSNKQSSVLLAEFPTPDDADSNPELAARWAKLLSVRDLVNKAIETAKKAKEIRKPLETLAKITAPAEVFELLKSYQKDLATIFLVSAVELTKTDDANIAVSVSPADGVKCSRCWLIKTDVKDDTGLCGRCSEVVLTSGL